MLLALAGNQPRRSSIRPTCTIARDRLPSSLVSFAIQTRCPGVFERERSAAFPQT